MPFQTWWEKQFKDSSPTIRREPEVCGQQCEWVIAQSSRAGINGLMKPHSALVPSLRVGQQPSGSGTIKLVVRPVMLEHRDDDDDTVHADSRNRFWILRGYAMPGISASRDDAQRSEPGIFCEVFGRDAFAMVMDLKLAILEAIRERLAATHKTSKV